MKEIINNPQLTARKRTSLSFSTRWLQTKNLLIGEILDFGCGYGFETEELKKQSYSIVGYDKYLRSTLPDKKFDTIICNEVLNVLEPEEQASVLMSISELLKPSGKAYFTLRRNLKREGFRVHPVYKLPVYQSRVFLAFQSIFSNEKIEIYEYQHYNQIRKEKNNCPFCNLANDCELITETDTIVAILDRFPVNEGHSLIIPKRHISNYFDLTTKEQNALWMVVNRCKIILERKYKPDGFNLGINVGQAAGQSIPHLHIHLIPRYVGDVENPLGGVRGVIPEKQKY